MVREEWPPSLVRDIARRKVVIVIGSGVSRHALGADQITRPPTWPKFLDKALEQLGRNVEVDHIHDAIRSGDLLHACEWLKNRYDEDWSTFLRAQFSDPRYTPGELHKLIAMLDSRIVFSLNFDEIYENKSREVNEASQFVKNYYDSDVCEFLRGDNRYIVKVHGNISSPATLIFTQKDYAEARVKHSLFYSAFDAALMTHTFLFIGCGHSDPDVNLLLENQAFRVLPGASEPHYFLTHREMPRDLKSSLRGNRNLKVLQYDKKDDFHTGLTEAIQGLLSKVNEAREMLSETTNW